MNTTYSVFVGHRWLATGTLDEVREASRPFADNEQGPVLAFEHQQGRQVDLDWRVGAPAATTPVAAAAPAPAGPGRPKLGVTSAEVTLLPRHWDWLAHQPGRASATLRRLVEQAMASEATDPARRREALGRVLWAVAGNLPGFEELTRALGRDDHEGVRALVASWPADLALFVTSWE